MLYIYPLKKDKKTFDADKEELGFAGSSRAKKGKVLANYPVGSLTEEQKAEIA